MKTYTRKRDAARGAERLAKKYPFITEYTGSTYNGEGYVACVTVNIKQDAVPPVLLNSAIVVFQEEVVSKENAPEAQKVEFQEFEPTLEEIKQVAAEEIKQVAHVAAEEVKQVAQVAEEKISNLVSIPDRREGVADRRKTPRHPVDFKVETVEMQQNKETGRIEEKPETKTKREFKNNRYRPGENTVSRKMWDTFDQFFAQNKRAPETSEAKEILKAHDWNPVNGITQYYDWKVFNGYKQAESTKARK
jgi:hypothetical protein